jgi:hypothetical protein
VVVVVVVEVEVPLISLKERFEAINIFKNFHIVLNFISI